MSFKFECQKLECHSNQNVTQIGMSLKLECHTNWNVTQIRVSLIYECHSNWKKKQIEKVVNLKTSKGASIGRISILFKVLSLSLKLTGGLESKHLCHVFPFSSLLAMWIRHALGALDVNNSTGRPQAVGRGGEPQSRVKVRCS